MQQKPTYNLKTIQDAFNDVNKLRMTFSAMQTQLELGFSKQNVVDAIQALTEKDFYKSMPPVNENFVSWQDVYKPQFKGVDLYIKFQVDHRGETIISFKEK